MPFENSLGGFEFFNSGVSDLAPQLKGFYGEPAVKTGAGESTTLFLVGDHFSNHETKVIAGNMKIEGESGLTILSRQLLQITIPGNVHVSDGVVDIHVATPYGVSNHIVVLVDGTSADAVADAISKHVDLKHVDKFTWSADTVNIQLTVDCRRFVKRVCLQSDLSIKSAETSPFSKDKGTAEFRGLIFEKTSGKDAEKKSFATANICEVEFEKGTVSVRGDQNGLEHAICEALTSSQDKYTVPQDIESFVIQGLLTFNEDAHPLACRIASVGPAEVMFAPRTLVRVKDSHRSGPCNSRRLSLEPLSCLVLLVLHLADPARLGCLPLFRTRASLVQNGALHGPVLDYISPRPLGLCSVSPKHELGACEQFSKFLDGERPMSTAGPHCPR